MNTSTKTAAHPPVKRLPLFGIITLALMMMAVDGTIVATALHAITDGLDTTVNWAGWTITAYAFGFVLMLPVSGRLSVYFGNRRVFIGSVLVFTLASLLCGLTNNIYALIALRVLQAAGGAGFTPSATGIIVDHFGDARDRAVGLFGSIFPLGAMIGPVFGGLFVTYWHWRGIFLVNVPIGLVVLLLAWRMVPHDRPRQTRVHAPFDLPGLAWMATALIAGMLGATLLGNGNTAFWSAAFLLPMTLALLASVLFFRHTCRTSDPLIPPALLFGKGFGVVNAINLLYGGTTIGMLVLIPLYAGNRYGFDAFDAGVLLFAQAAAAIFFSSTAAFILRHTGYRLPIYLGGFVMATGLLLLALPPSLGMSPFGWLASSSALVGMGGGIINPASRNAGLQLQPELAPAIAAVRSLCMQIGKIITISIATALVASASDPAITQAWVYGIAALLYLSGLILVRRVPEHKGAW